MNATRRTVLGWLLAAVIAPPRLVESDLDYFERMVYELSPARLNEFADAWTDAWMDIADRYHSKVSVAFTEPLRRIGR